MGKTSKKLLGLIAGSVLFAGSAMAQQDMALEIEGALMTSTAPAPSHMENIDTIYSGWLFRASQTQELELDDFENPGMIFVDVGLDLWAAADGAAGKSCMDCHGGIDSMAGVRTSMPKINDAGEMWTMEDNINNCRTTRMEADAWKWDAPEMLAVTAAIGLQSRGMPVDVAIDGAAAEWWERGRDLYYQRVGQLDMSCANCHEDNYGIHIRADHLSQGQINGFPVYRLKWAGLGSIHRRFKGCMKNIRATPYKAGSDEFTALELYVASRGTGLSVESPAVRN